MPKLHSLKRAKYTLSPIAIKKVIKKIAKLPGSYGVGEVKINCFTSTFQFIKVSESLIPENSSPS